MDRELFLAERAEGLGSTDSAAILRLSPYAGPLSVYQDKVGEAPEREPSLPMWLGLQLQRTVGELFVTQTGKRIRAANIQYKHPVFPFIRAHLDYRVIGERAVCEVKTARSRDGWGEDGSGDIPSYYWVQVQHQLAVTDLEKAYVAALFGHYDYRTYEIARDDIFIASLIDALVEFWETHVIPRVPPALDGSDESSRVVRKRWPRDEQPSVPATPEQAEKVALLIEADREMKAAAEHRTEMANLIMDQIGAHGGWDGPDWQITWRKRRDWTHTDWKLVAKAYREMLADRPSDELDALVSLHSEERTGGRPFLLKYAEDQSDE